MTSPKRGESHVDEAELAPAAAASEVRAAGDDPPVVARLVVEIRSDGSRTIARGAIEDHVTGDRVTVEAKAGSPLELAAALARMLVSTPRLANRALNARADPAGARGRRGLRSSLRKLARRRLGLDLDAPPEEDSER